MGARKTRLRISNICFIIAAIIVAIIILIQVFQIAVAVSKYNKTAASITTFVDAGATRGGGALSGVRVSYSVEGKNYETTIKYRKSSWEKGDDIDIYYDPNNINKTISIDYRKHIIFINMILEVVFIIGAIFYKDK